MDPQDVPAGQPVGGAPSGTNNPNNSTQEQPHILQTKQKVIQPNQKLIDDLANEKAVAPPKNRIVTGVYPEVKEDPKPGSVKPPEKRKPEPKKINKAPIIMLIILVILLAAGGYLLKYK